MARAEISLRRAIEVLEAIAPLSLAEAWDNVGLLIEPFAPRAIDSILFTIDLTEAVLGEAVAERVPLVVAYHPPIFEPLKRIVAAESRGRRIARALCEHIAVYSPHTSLDAAPAGVNDWLADGLPSGMRRSICLPNARIPLESGSGMETLVGLGRFVVLDEPAPLESIVARLKRHLGLRTLRIAMNPRHETERVGSVALCAGAGGSVITGSGADLLITGEMGHHHVLDALARGASVVLSEHSHTERGFLPHFARRVAEAAGVRTIVSAVDRDPLSFV